MKAPFAIFVAVFAMIPVSLVVESLLGLDPAWVRPILFAFAVSWASLRFLPKPVEDGAAGRGTRSGET